MPYESKRKVYIIDEVHMLTKEAFNALLKTLEEPPAHVVFILATTEEEKLLDTILSRCQVFKFRCPSRAVLSSTVQDIAKAEKFELSKAAADLIAVAADGSFRDALGVTQKVILASGDEIGDADEVAAIIGAPRTTLLMAVVAALHQKDVEKGLEAVATATAEHVEMKLFVRLLLERVRAVMLIRNLPAKKEELLAHFNEEESELIAGYAAEATTPLNSHLLVRLLTVAEQTSRTQLPYLPLEIALVEACEK